MAIYLQVGAAKDKELVDMKSKLQHTQDERQQLKLALQVKCSSSSGCLVRNKAMSGGLC